MTLLAHVESNSIIRRIEYYFDLSRVIEIIYNFDEKTKEKPENKQQQQKTMTMQPWEIVLSVSFQPSVATHIERIHLI